MKNTAFFGVQMSFMRSLHYSDFTIPNGFLFKNRKFLKREEEDRVVCRVFSNNTFCNLLSNNFRLSYLSILEPTLLRLTEKQVE